jgi:hypothetical protein
MSVNAQQPKTSLTYRKCDGNGQLFPLSDESHEGKDGHQDRGACPYEGEHDRIPALSHDPFDLFCSCLFTSINPTVVPCAKLDKLDANEKLIHHRHTSIAGGRDTPGYKYTALREVVIDRGD